ncbi:MAG: methyltransferase domain-containing protein [Actinomycetota bacterium]
MSKIADVTGFGEIDKTDDPEYFARFLAAGAGCRGNPEARAAALEALRVGEGQAILEVGCGLGAAVVEVAPMVGPKGRAVGVDISETMIEKARTRLDAQGLPVEFHRADARALPFEDRSFDGCRADFLLVSLAEPERALGELVRVLKPAGRLVVLDTDHETQFVDTPYPETTRILVRTLSEGEASGTIGRCLPRLFEEQGLVEIEVRPFVVLFTHEFFRLLLEGIVLRAQELGKLATDDARKWWDHLEEANASGTFFAGTSVFVVSGTRPG